MAYISSWGNDHEKPKYNLKRGEFSGSKSVAQSRVSHPNQTWQPLKVGHFQPFFRPKIHQNGRIFLMNPLILNLTLKIKTKNWLFLKCLRPYLSPFCPSGFRSGRLAAAPEIRDRALSFGRILTNVFWARKKNELPNS